MTDDNLSITTELNNKITHLNEKETAFLLEFRMMSIEEREQIQKLIEQLISDKHL